MSYRKFFLVLIAWFPTMSLADDAPLPWLAQKTPMTRPAKFFPINPAEHVRAVPQMMEAPVPMPGKSSDKLPMNVEQARQLLSIYPVQN
jgi:hypothetical protein